MICQFEITSGREKRCDLSSKSSNDLSQAQFENSQFVILWVFGVTLGNVHFSDTPLPISSHSPTAFIIPSLFLLMKLPVCGACIFKNTS
jgi:hypothetical protein